MKLVPISVQLDKLQPISMPYVYHGHVNLHNLTITKCSFLFDPEVESPICELCTNGNKRSRRWLVKMQHDNEEFYMDIGVTFYRHFQNIVRSGIKLDTTVDKFLDDLAKPGTACIEITGLSKYEYVADFDEIDLIESCYHHWKLDLNE